MSEYGINDIIKNTKKVLVEDEIHQCLLNLFENYHRVPVDKRLILSTSSIREKTFTLKITDFDVSNKDNNLLEFCTIEPGLPFTEPVPIYIEPDCLYWYEPLITLFLNPVNQSRLGAVNAIPNQELYLKILSTCKGVKKANKVLMRLYSLDYYIDEITKLLINVENKESYSDTLIHQCCVAIKQLKCDPRELEPIKVEIAKHILQHVERLPIGKKYYSLPSMAILNKNHLVNQAVKGIEEEFVKHGYSLDFVVLLNDPDKSIIFITIDFSKEI